MAKLSAYIGLNSTHLSTMAFALRFLTLLYILLAPLSARAENASAIPEDGHAAVVLAYHRIGEDTQASNTIETELFLEHIDEIEKGDYNVLPLPDLIAALKENKTLPVNTIAITFEGGVKSALTQAIPTLLEKNIPFTVFYSSDYADTTATQYMNWDDLKTLAKHKTVTLGLLPSSYARLKDLPKNEIQRQINKAKDRHRQMIGTEAQFFSYPFGEYSPEYKTIIENSGFTAAFGQQSGALSSSSDFFALPRFTMTDEYGDAARFKTAAETLPFPVQDIEPQGTDLNVEKPVIGFSVAESLKPNLKSLSCFVTGQPDPKIEILGSRVELRLKDNIDEDRIRVNCTLPGPPGDDDAPRWRWFGMLLVNGEESEEPETAASPQPTVLP